MAWKVIASCSPSSIDGEKHDEPDKFRIHIWAPDGGIVYDNQMGVSDSADPTTVIGGGSIVIHDGNA